MPVSRLGASRTIRALPREQLYSTASYQNKSLRERRLDGNNLTGWDFSGQDVTGTGFGRTTALGFTKEQLVFHSQLPGQRSQGR